MQKPGAIRALALLILHSAFCILPSAFAFPSFASPNRLKGERSRYLLQHATNPIDWHPWSPSAFETAKKENKPILLSIGYSTCHWCHVMEQESFSDAEVGRRVNAAFVSIKVDREERPDVDSVYIGVSRVLTGEAGWPLNVLLTPEGKPFFAFSYLPKDRFLALVDRTATMWRDQRAQLEASGEMVTQTLRASLTAGEPLTAEVLTKGYEQLAARFDAEHGGFLPAPKFPSAHQLMFLLRYWRRSGDAKALAMVETTLKAMHHGGLWDARGFGFHRYASDAAWREPHYEKMLYDQALLLMVYTEAWQATGNAEYRDVARNIVTYVLRDLRAPGGSFYAAQDADERYYKAPDRTKLPKPGRDEKILADWNGLMIAALAAAASAFDDASYAEAATRAADAVWTGGRSGRREQGARVYLDDYAFLTWAHLNLYEATFDLRHLERAIALTGESVERFRGDGGVFYITAKNAAGLLVRPRELSDGAIPAGNSVQLQNLVRLGRITADPKYDTLAKELLRGVSDEASLAPSTAAHLLTALDFHLGPSYEIVLAGADVRPLRRAVFTGFVPNKVVVHRPNGPAPAIVKLAPYTELQKPLRGGKPTAYVCTNYVCKLPTTDAAKVRDMLAGGK